MNRPFEGAWNLMCPCDNNPEMAKQLFGFNSVFIMDSVNNKNRPVPGIHNNVIRRWGIYPAFLGRAFCKTFSNQAIQDPTQRLMDKQWYNILLQVRSMFGKCPHCGKETFVDVFERDCRCVYCQEHITVLSLKAGRFTLPLLEKQSIWACQISAESDINIKAGEVIVKRGATCIKNITKTPWTVIMPDSSIKIMNKGDSFPLQKGLKLRYGQGETGEII